MFGLRHKSFELPGIISDQIDANSWQSGVLLAFRASDCLRPVRVEAVNYKSPFRHMAWHPSGLR